MQRSDEQLEFLAAHGCRFAQGYHLTRPIPAAEMTGLLHAELATDRLA